MRQENVHSRDWNKTSEIDDIDNHKKTSSTSMNIHGIKRGDTMQTQYPNSSGESSLSDEGSLPSSDCNDETREQGASIDETTQHFSKIPHNNSSARRKMSTCSNASSSNSAFNTLDELNSDCERNSFCSNTDSDDSPVRVNKYDVIIDKIVGLKLTRKNSSVKREESCIAPVRKNDQESSEILSENITNGNNENKPSLSETENPKDLADEDVNGNYEIGKNGKNCYRDDSDEYNDEHDHSDSDDDLLERGPVRPHLNGQSHHEKPYYTLNWLTNSSDDYEYTAEQILRNKHYSEKLAPCIDKLSHYGHSNRRYFNMSEQPSYDYFNAPSDSSSPENHYTETDTLNSNAWNDDNTKTAVPSIVFSNDPDEASLLAMLTNGSFQAAQTLSDPASIQNASPATTNSENSPDSPASSYNVQSFHGHSGASSPAQSSSSSSVNIGSPLLHLNIIGSPPDCQAKTRNFRVRSALSSSESSNHSFGETPSPLSYQSGVDQTVEEQLGLIFGDFSTWCPSSVSSATIVNSAETIEAIDTNELQLVEEIIRRDQHQKGNKIMKDTQVVPESQLRNDGYKDKAACPGKFFGNDLSSDTTEIHKNSGSNGTARNMFDADSVKSEMRKETQMVGRTLNSPASNIQQDQNYAPADVHQFTNAGVPSDTAQNQLVYPDFNDVYDLTCSEDYYGNNLYNDRSSQSTQSLMDFEKSVENFLAANYPDLGPDNTENSPTDHSSRPGDIQVNSETTQLQPSAPIIGNARSGYRTTATNPSGETLGWTFNEFQIPETVSSYRQNHSRRTSVRNIAPWSSLNLPRTTASERLKAGLDPREVENAMKKLLTKSTKDLAAGDEDGDTMLMCLVGNPAELGKKKAYLVPLVERLGSLSGALTMTNNRSEDALYLAAMNCPGLAYVTGYLAAAMLQRGIDVSQKLYHTRGDTLIHAIAAKGDSHGAVLKELLSLKTVHGNAVFDLSKRNYDGRTPLHVAVESHDPTGSGVNCIATTRLLLENGADPKIRETKSGDTALHMAISLSCDPDLIKTLLNNNGHEVVNMPNYNNNTTVHIVASLSHVIPIETQIKVFRDLILAGGLTNLQNRQGKTPLALVSSERKEAIRHIFHKKL